jgi:eukaryotic-like serine/threonine-protein kinase
MPGSPTDKQPNSDNRDPMDPDPVPTLELGQGRGPLPLSPPAYSPSSPTESGPAEAACPATIGSEAEGEMPPPTHFGRYRVLARLGAGGFGVVYQGFDDELRRAVAIKVPHPRRVTSPEDINAYLSEGRILAGLDHPGIVPIYDVGRSEAGWCYLV